MLFGGVKAYSRGGCESYGGLGGESDGKNGPLGDMATIDEEGQVNSEYTNSPDNGRGTAGHRQIAAGQDAKRKAGL